MKSHGAVLAATIGVLCFFAQAADFRVTDISSGPEEPTIIEHEAATNYYYVLLRGETTETINAAVDISLGNMATGVLTDSAPPPGQSFYRVLQAPTSSPLDVDGDGISDTYELLRTNILNALDPADGKADADGDGISNAQEYFRGTDPEVSAITTIAKVTPAEGETGVAVTRETTIEFSRPLNAASVISTTQFYAESNGRRILARVELSSDRRKATLFLLENLPGSSRVRITFDGAAITDDLGHGIDADGDGAEGGIKQFEFETLSITYVSGTAVIGRVFASELVPDATGTTNVINTPLADVLITVDGAEEDLLTWTDSDGNFYLDCPAGRFFVHVDGRTAIGSDYPNGDYYPVVGKAWEAVAGRDDNLAGGSGELYLPLIRAGTLQPVSAGSDTTITFAPSVLSSNPALAGVSITVPADSLFSDNGTRGGSVGIAPVAAERLPEPLPQGLNFPLVITVQTDGPSNFDRPVPVRFPNLPDPVTGEVLSPGAKTALWSFNHDTGRWEIQGAMTVSVDGNYVDSDAGVGIRQPGWHGAAPGSTGEGGETNEDECEADPEECPQCETDEDCDDDSECTINDRCENGVCAYDDPQPSCGASAPVAIDYSGWVEEFWGETYSGTIPSLQPIEYTICYDAGARAWRLQVTRFQCSGKFKYAQNYTEPNPVDGGNVGITNYCDMIRELGAYNGRGYLDGGYHTLEASRAHENIHYAVDLPATLGPLWADTQLVIQSSTASCELGEGGAEAELHGLADAAFNAMEASFWDAWLAADAEHDSGGGPAYQAGQDALNNTVAAIEAYASAQGWPACPAEAASAQLHGVPPLSILLTNLSAIAATNSLHIGESTTIQVVGTFSDGSTAPLPAEGFPLTFATLKTNVISVATNGTVTAVASGSAVIVVQAPVGGSIGPRFAMVQISVVNPDDRDGDMLRNSYEVAHGLDPDDATDARLDRDGDGLANLDEFRRGTSPSTWDSDGDGVDDGQEVIRGNDPKSTRARSFRAVTGKQYYLLYNLDTYQITQRGLAQKNGIAHQNLLLGPNTRYRHWLLHAPSLRVAVADYVSAGLGEVTELPAFTYRTDSGADSDGDGLTDLAEFIVGSDRLVPDTDNDGVSDAVEVTQGSDPLDGQPLPMGIIATVDTPGTAQDVCVDGDRAVVADGSAGVALLNVFNGLDPVLIAQVDTAGYATAVACEDAIAAVADSSNGLAVVDFRDPAAALLLHQVVLGGNATCVAIADGVGYVGLQTNGVAAVDLASGTMLGVIEGIGDVDDVAVSSSHLFVVAGSELRIYRTAYDGLGLVSRIPVSGSPSPNENGRKLFVCGGTAFVGNSSGYKSVDVSDVLNPALLGTSTVSGQLEVHDLAHNGSHSLIAVTSSRGGRSYQVTHYDTTNPLVVTQATAAWFLSSGRGLALGHSLAYVAASSGLNVVNYLGFDTSTNPPAIDISSPPQDVNSSLPGTQVYGGSPVTIGVQATDNVQVRSVDLLIDGVRAATDTSWPFTFTFVAPEWSASRTNVTVQFRAVDTGGNTNLSSILTLELIEPPSSPFVVSSYPDQNGTTYDAITLHLAFDSPIVASNLSVGDFVLTSLGADSVPGGGDDQPVTLSSVSLSGNGRLLEILLPDYLAVGSYQLTVHPGRIVGTNGITMASLYTLAFTVVYHPSTIYWISDTDGYWNDGARWSGGRVPTNGDPVVIDRPAANPVIYVNTNVLIRNIVCVEALVVTNRTFTVNSVFDSALAGPVTISNSTIAVIGSGATLNATGITHSDDTSFTATNGASLFLPSLTNFTGAAISDKTVRAHGAGSRVVMPALTSMAGPFGNTIFFFFPSLHIQALSGGSVELPGVAPTLEGRIRILADGLASAIDISSVQTMLSPGSIIGSIETRNGGTLRCSNLTALTSFTVTLNNNSAFDTRQISALTNAEITVNGGAPDLSAVSQLANLSITARSNANVILPLVTNYPAGSAVLWKADGLGSTLTFPAIAALSGPVVLPGIPKLQIQALNGARVDLSALAAKPLGRISVLADGNSSTVDFSGISEMEGTGTFTSSFEAKNGGIISATPTNLVNVDLVLHASGSIATAQILSYTSGQVTTFGVSPDFSNLLSVNGAGFIAYTGAVVTLPNVQTVSYPAPAIWEARGPGAQLAFSSLTNVQGPLAFGGLPRLAVQAFSGGLIDLTGVSQVTAGRFGLLADGTNSLVNLGNTTNLSCAGFSTADIRNAGTIRFSTNGFFANGIELELNGSGSYETPLLELGATADLLGAGTYTGTLINGGEVRPGTSAGAITIIGDYIQSSAGRLSVELGGLTAGTQFDQLVITGTATLAGTLGITTISSYVIVPSDTFRIIACGSRLGTFTTVSGATQGSVTLQVDYADTSVDLTAP